MSERERKRGGEREGARVRQRNKENYYLNSELKQIFYTKIYLWVEESGVLIISRVIKFHRNICSFRILT